MEPGVEQNYDRILLDIVLPGMGAAKSVTIRG